jgi:hypothetical protein
MAANIAENRTNVQAGAAPNALQGVSLFGIG